MLLLFVVQLLRCYFVVVVLFVFVDFVDEGFVVCVVVVAAAAAAAVVVIAADLL